ncbi:NAD(P)/FAD-dependent oxidoreductase [Streptomyces sp. NPDC050658]|uniref:NAD(P)/FAD-dependent oxidoreductase n=1 Tax=unclassified Streptomyces TaxID=2593676 RepID=UPI00341E34E8
MSRNVEIVVVGAGMFGSAAAKYLCAAGADVTVIGPAGPGRRAAARLDEFAAHHDEARIVRRLGWDRVWGTVDGRSAERFRDIEAASGVGFFHECGSLAVMAQSIKPRTDAMLQMCRSDGVPVERLSSSTLSREFPALGLPAMTGGVEGVLERENAGYLNPRRLVRAQLDLAVAQGGRLLRGAVDSVRKDTRAGVWRLHVRGDSGDFELGAEKVLLATGSLINHTGALPPGQQLAVYPFTEPNLLAEVAASQLDHLRDLPTVVTVDPADSGNDNTSLYLLPPIRYPDGRWYVRIGPAMQPLVQELHQQEEIHSWYAQQRITAEQSDFLQRMLRLLLPDLEPLSVREACCVIDKTPSRYPYLGPVAEDDSLTVVAGGNGHGARGCDEIGRLAATVVLGQSWDFPLPRDTFAPIARSTPPGDSRPNYCTPPFGLC